MNGREVAALVPLVVMALVMGVAPMIFLNATKETINSVRAIVEEKVLKAER